MRRTPERRRSRGLAQCLTGIHAITSLAGMPRKIRTQRDQKISRASISDLLTPPILTPTPLTRLPQKKALEIYTSGIREKLDLGLLVPRPITDVTLSGATMNAGGAWLEVGGDGVRVYGDTGEIHWFKDPVPSVGAWMNVWLAGLESGQRMSGRYADSRTHYQASSITSRSRSCIRIDSRPATCR